MVLELEPLLLGASLERLERDEMRIGKRFPDDEAAARFQYPLEFGERSLPIRNFAENENQIRGVETVVRVRQPLPIAADRLDVPVSLPPHPHPDVLDHRLLNVDSVYRPIWLDCSGDRSRVIAGSRAEFEDPFSGLWIEDRA
jgi:hypothetical protein